MSKIRNRNRKVETVTATEVTEVDTAPVYATLVDDATVANAVDVSVNLTDEPATDEPATEVEQPRDPLSFTILEVMIAVDKTVNDGHWSRHRETRAGIPIPKGFGLCARAWYLFEYLAGLGTTDTATVVEIGFTVYNLNRGNLRTEISRYRKYHGIARPGKSVAPVATVAPVAPVTELIKKVDA